MASGALFPFAIGIRLLLYDGLRIGSSQAPEVVLLFGLLVFSFVCGRELVRVSRDAEVE